MKSALPQLHSGSDVQEVQLALTALEDPKRRAVNERHGNDYGVNLTEIRALAKQLKSNHELGLQLWELPDTAAQLLAVLLFRPRSFEAADITNLVLSARAPKVREWVVNYLAKKHQLQRSFREQWVEDHREVLVAAGWELMAHSISKRDPSVDVPEVLTRLESHMGKAPVDTQWAMNNALAQIGINHPTWRDRAIELGQKIGAFKDYPTPAGCLSPYAPIWITEMVRRQDAST